jgi:hypothetical protein
MGTVASTRSNTPRALTIAELDSTMRDMHATATRHPGITSNPTWRRMYEHTMSCYQALNA